MLSNVKFTENFSDTNKFSKRGKNMVDFIGINFNFEKHLLYLAHFGMINKGIYNISNESIDLLTSSCYQNINEIQKLRSLINIFEVEKVGIVAEANLKIKMCNQFQERINKNENYELLPKEYSLKIETGKI